MKFQRTQIPDIVLVHPTVHGDQRGFFLETWNARQFSNEGLPSHFVQDNFSRSVRHTLRGLHYQVQQAQGKLVRVVAGTAFDVAVDLRRSSPTFGKWVSAVLSGENRVSLWIPPGFGHAFLVLSDSADFAYKCTDYYAPEFERTIRWDDAELAIAWPLPPGATPVISAKDAKGVAFKDAACFP